MRDLQIAVPAHVGAIALLRTLADQMEQMQPSAVITLPVPRIGSLWKDAGGVYAGVARGLDGAADYPLIVGEYLPGKPAWNDGLEQAKRFGDGRWRVPTRRESSLCMANVPELFEKEWHWTCEQCEGYGVFAWAQLFGYGGQNDYRKGSDFRVRLVRSVIVID